MAHPCPECFEPWCSDDDDDLCDSCCIEKISNCEIETGHKKTRQSGEDKICKGCDLIIS